MIEFHVWFEDTLGTLINFPDPILIGNFDAFHHLAWIASCGSCQACMVLSVYKVWIISNSVFCRDILHIGSSWIIGQIVAVTGLDAKWIDWIL